MPAMAPGDRRVEEEDGEGPATIIDGGEVVVPGGWVGDVVEVGLAVEDELEVASTGKLSPGLNLKVEFLANANCVSNV